MTTLTDAHREWASRPADERYSSVAQLRDALSTRRRESIDGKVDMTEAWCEVNGHVRIFDGHNEHVDLTHWALGQFCNRLEVPRDLLPKLNSSVASAVLNDRLVKAVESGRIDKVQRALLRTDGNVTLRAFHGEQYDRVWDAQVAHTLVEYLPPGWRNPVAYAQGQFGAPLEPSGLYAGDRDMFAFLIDGGDWRADQPNAGSFDVDGEQFNRGFFVWNSEVGAKSFGWTTFMFDVVCGNHYVWGARDVHTFRTRHAHRQATKGLAGFRRYLEVLNEDTQDVTTFARAVRAAKERIVAPVTADKVETLDVAFGAFKDKFTRSHVTLALDAMLREEKGVVGSAYDWLAGLTAVARTLPNADDRSALEVQASKHLLTR